MTSKNIRERYIKFFVGKNHKQILSATCKQKKFIPLFEKKWFANIELISQLKKEGLLTGIRPLLKKLSKEYPLYLISLRQKKRNLHGQLGYLNIRSFFQQILTSAPGSDGVKTKSELLKNIKSLSSEDLIIGDTEIDVLSGKSAGIRTCAIYSGIRSKKFLAELKPDYLLSHATQILKVL